MRSLLSRVLSISLIITLISQMSYAVTYPVGTPALEIPGGAYNTYFTNMFDICIVGEVLVGFTSTGTMICDTIPSSPVSDSTLSLSGSLIGLPNYLAKYTPTGTGINISQIFDNGTNVGIGTTSPTAKLHINGQIRITGGTPGAGRILTSDATGLATWSSSISGATATGITGGTHNYIPKFGTGGTGLYSSQFFDNGTSIGIGNTSPAAKLDISGTIRINGGGVGSGKVLTSDATGLASWQPSVSTADFALSGAFWRQTGNSGTISTTDYVGTSDNQDLVFRRNLTEGMRLTGPDATLSTTRDASINSITLGRGGGSIATNTINGYNALYSNIAGYQNVAIGMSALYSNNTGFNNTVLGYLAGSNLTSGSNNVFIGYNTQPNISATASNQLNIGNWIYGNNGNIGIGILSPTTRLDVAGSLRIVDGTQGTGKVLTSGPTGIATWEYPTAAASSSTLSLDGPLIGVPNYVAKYTPTGTGINISQIFDNGTNIGIGTATPGAKLDISGQIRITGGSPGLGRILTSDATGLAVWSSSISGATATGITGGVENYISKFGTGGTGLYPSQMIDTGTGIGLGTLSPTSILDINGQIRLRTGSSSGYYLVSDSLGRATWTAPIAVGLTLSGSILGSTLYYNGTNWIPSTNIYNSGSNVGIGTSTPGAKLTVSGATLISGDLTVQGKVITDTLVNRTVTNITISGSLLPDISAPSIYRDIGSATLPWQNLYLSNQIRIAGGSPGLGRILTSDATGLAYWATSISGATATGITGGVQNYISKFGTGGNGLFASQIFDTGTGIGIATVSPTTALDVNGRIRLRTGAGTGLYLVSDATGLASWTSAVTATAFSVTGSVLGSTLYYNGTNWTPSTNIYNSGSNIGIGTATPSAKLDINGQIRITGGTPGAGHILTSDATGLATWSSSISGATATGITGGTHNYIPKFGTGGTGLYSSQIFDNGTNIGVGTGGGLTTRLTIDSGIANDSGLRFSRINIATPLTANNVLALGVDGSGKVLPISPISNIAVYTGTLRNSPPTPNPDLTTFNVSYDFNQYFAIPGKQSFVVSKGDGPSNNGPYFKENGTNALCSITGSFGGPGAYDCIDPDPVTGLSASPYNSFTMSAKGDTFGYQLALGARGDAPLFARSGRFNGSQTGGLYTNDAPFQTPAPWQRVLSVPANHPEYLYINTGLNSQLQAITGGGQVGIGTTFPDMRLVVANNAGSTSRIMQIKRGTQGADATMITAYGTPYLGIGGLENRVNSLQTIGFGYSSVAGALRYAPAEIGFLTTSVSGNTQGDIVFANRASTTNIAPTEVMRITSTGSVGIGTTSPIAKLDVNGKIRLSDGTQGSGRVLMSDASGISRWADVNTLGVGGFNFVGSTDYSSLNTISKQADATDMVFQLADNATDGVDRFVFQMDNHSGDANQRYPMVMNGLYAAFDPRYSLNFNSSTQNYGSGTMLSATAYMDYVNRRFGIGTMSPTEFLQVTGTNAGILVGDSTGSVGALYFGNTSHGIKRNYNGVGNDVGTYTTSANLQFSANGSNTTQMTLSNVGNLGIGQSTPAAKLDVAGTVKLGTNGTQLNAIIRATVSQDIPSIAASACSIRTFAVNNTLTTGTAMLSPASALNDRMAITYARVSAANTVEAKFCNQSGGSIDLPSMNYFITVIQ